MECEPDKVNEAHDGILANYENSGQYPPKFHLQFNRKQPADKSTCIVTITLSGFVSGDLHFKTKLGEKLGKYYYIA